MGGLQVVGNRRFSDMVEQGLILLCVPWKNNADRETSPEVHASHLVFFTEETSSHIVLKGKDFRHIFSERGGGVILCLSFRHHGRKMGPLVEGLFCLRLCVVIVPGRLRDRLRHLKAGIAGKLPGKVSIRHFIPGGVLQVEDRVKDIIPIIFFLLVPGKIN